MTILFAKIKQMIRYIFESIGTAFLKMQRKPARAIGTVILLSVLFFVVFLLLMFTSFTSQSVHFAGGKVQITFFLQSDVSENQLALLKAKMMKMEKEKEISSFAFTSSQSTIAQFAQENPDTFAFIKQNLDNEIPSTSSFTITPGTRSIESLIQYLLTGEFKDVIDTSRLAKSSAMIVQGNRVLEFLKFIEYGIFGVIGVVILAITVVIAWFIVSSFALRKKEIFVMRLVGGSAWFIRVPFLVESFVMTSVSLALGWSLFFVLRFQALQKLMLVFSTRTEAIAVAKTLNTMWADFLQYLPHIIISVLLVVLFVSFFMMEYLLRKQDILE